MLHQNVQAVCTAVKAVQVHACHACAVKAMQLHACHAVAVKDMLVHSDTILMLYKNVLVFWRFACKVVIADNDSGTEVVKASARHHGRGFEHPSNIEYRI